MRLAARLMTILMLLAPATADARGPLPPNFVYLRGIDRSIAQDMRYAGPNNFTGRKLPGYDAPECVLRSDAALALKRVQADLARQNLSLKTYDCYRPTRAVAAMAHWSQSGRDGTTKRFYPELEKRTLFAYGYIAARSAHSTGTAVDLTLISRNAPPAVYDPSARYGACTAPAPARAPDNSLDMGTGFDCFDPRSYTASAAIGAEQKRARGALLAAMHRRGFHNYFREWWHFTYGPRPAQAYDVPIAPR